MSNKTNHRRRGSKRQEANHGCRGNNRSGGRSSCPTCSGAWMTRSDIEARKKVTLFDIMRKAEELGLDVEITVEPKKPRDQPQ